MKQRKIMLITLLLLAFSSAVIAQEITAKGIKGGFNIATLTGDDVDDEYVVSKLGFAFGCFIVYEVNELFSLQPELLFTMKGLKYVHEDSNISGNYEYYQKHEGSQNLSYLEIPILAKLNIPIRGNIKPNVFLGPALAFNLNATYDLSVEFKTYEYGELIYEESASVDGQDLEDIKSVDFGLVLGAGVEFGKISVDARYDTGLTSIDDSSESFKVYNSVISIMLSISI